MSGEAGRNNCLRFVDATGLKALFPAFMGKVTSIQTFAYGKPLSDDSRSVLLGIKETEKITQQSLQ